MTDYHEMHRKYRKALNEAPTPDPDDLAWDYMNLLGQVGKDLERLSKLRTSDGADEVKKRMKQIKKLSSELGVIIFDIEKNLR